MNRPTNNEVKGGNDEYREQGKRETRFSGDWMGEEQL